MLFSDYLWRFHHFRGELEFKDTDMVFFSRTYLVISYQCCGKVPACHPSCRAGSASCPYFTPLCLSLSPSPSLCLSLSPSLSLSLPISLSLSLSLPPPTPSLPISLPLSLSL